MKIDWKHLATTAGYLSMKAAVANEAKNCSRQKWCKAPDERYAKSFRFAINRAKHYAHHLGKTVEEVLNEWEDKRTYNFMNYYQDCKLPKFHSKCLKPNGINAHRKYYKTWRHHSSKRRYGSRVLSLINEEQMKSSTKKKARWDNARKKRAAYFRDKRSL